MKGLTLRNLIGKFLASAEVTMAAGTVRSYSHHLNYFLRTTKNKLVRSLRPIHLTESQRSWHDWQAVQRLFRWAIDEACLVKKNPFAKVKAPPRSSRKRILTPVELVQFIRRAHRAWRCFLIALRELAARPQEVRALRWDHLQSENPSQPIGEALAIGRAVFVLWEFKDREKRRDQDAPRVLLVTPRLGRLLLRLQRANPDASGEVFLNTRKKPFTKNAVRCMMRSLRRKLGCKRDARGENVVAYTVRHSCATLAASRGVVDRVLADWLGHVETRTTRRYQHLTTGHIREALKRIERPKRVITAKPPTKTNATKKGRRRSTAKK